MGLGMNAPGWPPSNPPRVQREREQAAARQALLAGFKKREERPRHPSGALSNVSNAANKQDPKSGSLQSRMLNRIFLLDMMDKKKYASVKKEIERLGGTVVDFYGEGAQPSLIISDHPYAAKLTPREQSKGIHLRPEFMKKVPMILREALNNKIRISHVDQFWMRIDDLKRKSQSPVKPDTRKKPVTKMGRARRMTAPFIRFDDINREFAPNIKEYASEAASGTIYIGEYFGNSLFNKASLEQQERRIHEIEDELNGDIGSIEDNKVIKPKTAKNGFCEACNRATSDLRLHYSSKEHLNVVNKKGFFDDVDALLGSFTSAITCPGKPLLRRRFNSVLDDDSLHDTEDTSSFAYTEGPYNS